MGAEIDFRTFDAFKASVRGALESAELSEGQLEALKGAVARDEVTVHSINTSKLSDGEKAIAALLMLLRDNPNDARLSRISANMAEFFDRVVEGKEGSFESSLRVAALGVDPFASWTSAPLKEIGSDRFKLADASSSAAIEISQTESGDIDVSQARTWTPAALQSALGQLATVTAPSPNAMQQRFHAKLDQLEAGIIQRAHAALTGVHDEKVAGLNASATTVEDAVANPQPPSYQVPQASIDAVGHALTAMVDRLPADERTKVFEAGLADFKAIATNSLANLTDRECGALVRAMEALVQVDGGRVTVEAARRAKAARDAIFLLTVFRAIDASLEVPGVHEAVRNLGSVREAAELLLQGPLLDPALEKLHAELNDPDPLGLHRGLSLGAFDRQTPITGVNAVETEEGVTAYQLVTPAGTWTVDPRGIAGPEQTEPLPIGEWSIDALRTLTAAFLAASPDTVGGVLGYFRKTEERTKGGYAYATLLENLSACLAEKITQGIAAIDRVVAALLPLEAIRDREG